MKIINNGTRDVEERKVGAVFFMDSITTGVEMGILFPRVFTLLYLDILANYTGWRGCELAERASVGCLGIWPRMMRTLLNFWRNTHEGGGGCCTLKH